MHFRRFFRLREQLKPHRDRYPRLAEELGKVDFQIHVDQEATPEVKQKHSHKLSRQAIILVAGVIVLAVAYKVMTKKEAREHLRSFVSDSSLPDWISRYHEGLEDDE